MFLKNYFVTISEKTKENINPSHKHFSDFRNNRHQNSFFLSTINKSEIQNIISLLDLNKSVGANNIPMRILKLLKNNISSRLSDIFNISFSTCVFLTILKVTKVLPVYKKDSKLDFPSYQPISLLSNIEKILEKLLKILEKVEFGCGIFVDLLKAFDSVEHDILLAKLEHRGIRGIVNNSLNPTFFDRKQFVSVNGHVSNKTSIKYGVPQGSVLEPQSMILILIIVYSLYKVL